jgi:hypothetical protein
MLFFSTHIQRDTPECTSRYAAKKLWGKEIYAGPKLITPLCGQPHNAEDFIGSAEQTEEWRHCREGDSLRSAALPIKFVELNRGPTLWGLKDGILCNGVMFATETV